MIRQLTVKIGPQRDFWFHLCASAADYYERKKNDQEEEYWDMRMIRCLVSDKGYSK